MDNQAQNHPKSGTSLLWLLLVIIPWALAVHIRLIPSELPCAHQWAADTVYNTHREQWARDFIARNPGIEKKRAQTLMDREFERYKACNRDTIKKEIEEKEKLMVSQLTYQHEGKHYAYLGDYDSYYALRYARNLLNHGIQADCRTSDGREWDHHVLAPLGRAVQPTLHPLLIAAFYKFMAILDPSMTLMRAAFYLPLLLSLASALLIFLAGWRLSGPLGGLTAAVLCTVNPAFIARSLGADTDIYNIALPVAVLFCIIGGLKAQRLAYSMAFMAFSGFFLGLYSFAWIGWWFLLYLVFSAFVLSIATIACICHIQPTVRNFRQALKSLCASTGVLIISTFLFTALFSGVTEFFQAWARPFIMTAMNAPLQASLWPNVFPTVEELQPGNPFLFLHITGGEILLFLSLAGIAVIMTDKRHNLLLRVTLSFLLLLWMGGVYYGSLNASRFLFLVVPAFSLAAGICIGRIHQTLPRRAGMLVVIGAVILIVPQVFAGYHEAKSHTPVMNAAYDRTFSILGTMSSPDAIVSACWDLGDFTTYGANRAVTVDNHTLELPPTYWIDRFFITAPEDNALAILKMLNCGSNNAYIGIYRKTGDTLKTLAILDRALCMKASEAEKYLTETIGDASEIMPLIHGTPREQYLIVTGDMVRKAPQWAHIGLWNFGKAQTVSIIRQASPDVALRRLQFEQNISFDRASELLYMLSGRDLKEMERWISPYPSFLSSPQSRGRDGLFRCVIEGKEAAIAIDLKKRTARVHTTEGSGMPFSLVFLSEKGEPVEHFYKNPRFPFSVIHYRRDEEMAVPASPELAGTMFTKLLFFKGKGLRHFTRIHDDRTYDGNEIILYRVDFD